MNVNPCQTFALLSILLPFSLAFPNPIYDTTNYRRVLRTNNNQYPFYTPTQKYDDQPYQLASSSLQYPSYHQTAPSQPYEADYIDDDDRHDRKYQYGTKTYHGEYKPSTYYYARAPSYSYYDDRSESAIDNLHEEMLQEDRQRNSPPRKLSLQNVGQAPKSVTKNFLRNLYLYNNGMSAQPSLESDANEFKSDYDDDDDNIPYYTDITRQPYDYYDPLNAQRNQINFPNQYAPPESENKQNYFAHEINDNNHEQDDYMSRGLHDSENEKDKEEQDLKSLRKSHSNKNKWDDSLNTDDDSFEANSHYDNAKTKSAHSSSSSLLDASRDASLFHDEFDSGFDYDDDAWINWDRKRSLFKKERSEHIGPLRALELKLQMAQDASKKTNDPQSTTTTVESTTVTSSPAIKSAETELHSKLQSNNKANMRGQKEVVLSRPSQNHRFSPILDALAKTSQQEVKL